MIFKFRKNINSKNKRLASMGVYRHTRYSNCYILR